ncbi:hypothetical protein DFH06DRAFT_1216565 [Mycena polygramma]|nr:hypothetical protein DFH06DRAFT_1216565 [Mycena polygramma]
MHLSALVSLATLSCLTLVAADPPLKNSDIVSPAPTSEPEISSVTKHHKRKCTGYCKDKTCDMKHGCACYDKFQFCYKPKSTSTPQPTSTSDHE